jgi:tetratricopeptide (TPR) repeat protein
MAAIFDLFRLFQVAYFRRRSKNLNKALKIIEKIIKNDELKLDFLEPYKGFILVCMEDYKSARNIFIKNARKFEKSDLQDHMYITLYCNYFINAGIVGWDGFSLIEKAHNLEPEYLTRYFLVLPSKERLAESLTQ